VAGVETAGGGAVTSEGEDIGGGGGGDDGGEIRRIFWLSGGRKEIQVSGMEKLIGYQEGILSGLTEREGSPVVIYRIGIQASGAGDG